jgi:hypothetical protein
MQRRATARAMCALALALALGAAGAAAAAAVADATKGGYTFGAPRAAAGGGGSGAASSKQPIQRAQAKVPDPTLPHPHASAGRIQVVAVHGRRNVTAPGGANATSQWHEHQVNLQLLSGELRRLLFPGAPPEVGRAPAGGEGRVGRPLWSWGGWAVASLRAPAARRAAHRPRRRTATPPHCPPPPHLPPQTPQGNMPRSGSHVYVKGQPLAACTAEPAAQRDRSICVATMTTHEGGRRGRGGAEDARGGHPRERPKRRRPPPLAGPRSNRPCPPALRPPDPALPPHPAQPRSRTCTRAASRGGRSSSSCCSSSWTSATWASRRRTGT